MVQRTKMNTEQEKKNAYEKAKLMVKQAEKSANSMVKSAKMETEKEKKNLNKILLNSENERKRTLQEAKIRLEQTQENAKKYLLASLLGGPIAAIYPVWGLICWNSKCHASATRIVPQLQHA